MIPWLLISQMIVRQAKPLSELVGERMRAFPSSGEINRRVENAAVTIKKIEAQYAAVADSVNHVDGLSAEYSDWRFNLRASNTEPLLRLNVESRGDEALMKTKTAELLKAIGGEPG